MKLCAIGMLLPLMAIAQESGGPPPGVVMQMPAPRNLKLLAPEDVMPSMKAYNLALHVKCEYCHVADDYPSDKVAHKITARKMIAMTREINAKNFGGKERVGCYTCHRGGAQPPAAAPQKLGTTGKE